MITTTGVCVKGISKDGCLLRIWLRSKTGVISSSYMVLPSGKP